LDVPKKNISLFFETSLSSPTFGEKKRKGIIEKSSLVTSSSSSNIIKVSRFEKKKKNVFAIYIHYY